MTSYTTGQVVARNGNIFRMYSGTSGQQSAGTSGAAWIPTAALYQTDGSVIWINLGADPTPTTLPGAPNAVFFAQAFNYGISQGLTRRVGNIDIGLTANLAITKQHILISGNPGPNPGFASDLSFLGPPLGIVGSSPAQNQLGSFIEFCTTADRVITQANQPWTTADVNVFVEVNGRRVYAGVNAVNNFHGGGANVGNGSSTVPALDIDLAALPANSLKTVRIYGRDYRRLLQYINVKPQFNVWAPPVAFSYRLAFEGDSLSVGTNGAANPYGTDYCNNVAARLGTSQVYNNCVGATGFAATGGSFTTFLQRLPSIVTFAPDVLILASCHNGVNLTADVVSYINAVRAALPNCWIVICGTALLHGESSTGTILGYENSVMAAAPSFATDKLVTFIPKLSATVPWYTETGTGNAASPTGGGSNDANAWVAGPITDGHPTPVGYEYDAIRVARAVADAARSLAVG